MLPQTSTKPRHHSGTLGFLLSLFSGVGVLLALAPGSSAQFVFTPAEEDVAIPYIAHSLQWAVLSPEAPASILALHEANNKVSIADAASLLLTTPSTSAFSSGVAPRDTALADLNKDSRIDILVASESTNRVMILTQRPDGGFTFGAGPIVGAAPKGIASADFNRDGVPDAATANSGDGTVSILVGDEFSTLTVTRTISLGGKPLAIVAAFINADSFPDLAVADQQTSTITILLNTGANPPAFVKLPTIPVGSRPHDIVADDLDRDGHTDLVVANANSGSITILRGAPDGAVTLAATLGSGIQPNSLTIADIDLDGRPDIAVANTGENSVSLFRNTGDLVFEHHPIPLAYRPSAVALTDLDDDLKPDMVIAHLLTPRVDTLLNETDYPGGDCPGDTNGTLHVNLYDFVDIVTNFGQPTAAPFTDGDINGDSQVDIYDFSIFAINFGNVCGET